VAEAPQFIVLLCNGQKAAWGPFGKRGDADQFAEFVTAEIDPAEVRTLSSPVGELLAWRNVMKEHDRA
jgi:hypothetical protein